MPVHGGRTLAESRHEVFLDAPRREVLHGVQRQAGLQCGIVRGRHVEVEPQLLARRAGTHARVVEPGPGQDRGHPPDVFDRAQLGEEPDLVLASRQ
ncbi:MULTISPECIES: hypothetical protein [unclassified Streptomyces]|uniref:hypothetical protein n=1 Tax=unclassified Streptomyces TaxID=2593676 RepID=UPI0013A6E8A5|nr:MULTISPECIES: hypothetical protein [unclassified Streptomyces]